MDTFIVKTAGSPQTSDAAPLVQVRDLHLTVTGSAGPVNILRGIDLDIGAGEAVGIVGPSGSGKTSLLMVLAGLEQATSGSVSVAGRSLGGLDEDALARFRRDTVGIVFQAFHLIPAMTALENVAVPLELAGVRDATERAAASLASATACVTCPACFPGASSSAWPLPAPMPASHACFSLTSRPATSTWPPAAW
jgi:putative ABC transport system ATP-binding protein